MNRFMTGLRQIGQYPSAMAGILVILFLVGLSLYAVFAIPYRQALDLWRGGEIWQDHPRNAAPAWVNWFRLNNLPSTIIVEKSSADVESENFQGWSRVRIPLEFSYTYDEFPSEMNLFLKSRFQDKGPFIRLFWETPDGREILLGGHRPRLSHRVALSQDRNLERRLDAPPHMALLSLPDDIDKRKVLKGDYRLVIDAVFFEEESSLETKFISYGRVHGPAGTDHQRRDIMVALLWGTPIALAFGLLAAVGTTITTLIIAATGVWFGNWIDAAIQRITEVNMILPMLPILVMVGALYSRSIWVMLGVVVLLGIFSAGIKMYRAMLLPIRESPYIEAARAYGAGHSRIILRYMIPRVLPVLIPGFVTLIPTFVFLEASLAVLGLGDPVLPTWGKVLHDAQGESALYNGYYYWVISPAFMLMLTGLGFAMLGFALDRIFNPRLRSI